MPLTGTFKFVKIPADTKQPVELVEADKKGGLEDDALVKHAKNYFHVMTGAKERADRLEGAGPTERSVLASQIRNQLSGSSPDMANRLAEMDDDTVLNVIYKSQSQPACEIVALTVPCAGNNYQAVSLYSAENAKEYGLQPNTRATAILTACGHTGEVVGDAFVGRASDNEATDIWERIDFDESDADPQAAWCVTARSQGGGGGTGKSTASSLSGMIQQQMNVGKGGNIHAIDGSGESKNLYGLNGAPPVVETWGSWTQTESEVELKFPVASGTKAKYCKINFGRTTLKVTVAAQPLLQGTLFDPVSPDECTYTLEDSDSGRELCVTLYKSDPRTWPYVAAPKR